MSNPASTASHAPNPLWVVCLCAQWCGTCGDYTARFESLRHEFPTLTFDWIDIEDQADLVDPVEVDNFPTLLLMRNGRVRFFGSLTPHIETLRRLIQAQEQEPDDPTRVAAGANAQIQALADRLTTWQQQRETLATKP